MEKVTKYIEGVVSVTVTVNEGGTLAFSSMAYAQKDLADLFTLLDSTEVRQALGLPVVAADGLPKTFTTAEDLDIDWPEGTEVADVDGDRYKLVGGDWVWYKYKDGSIRLEEWDYGDDSDTLRENLPATVLRVGA